MPWPTKKLGEIETVKRFLENEKISFDNSEIKPWREDNSPIDTIYKDKKFQIVEADFEFQKLRGTVPKDSFGVKVINRSPRHPQDVWKDFIINPIKKKNKYGKSAKGIILLIDSYTRPPWIEEQLTMVKEVSFLNHQLKKLCFDKIYLVCPKKNIKVYP